MSIRPDTWIIRMAREHGMIEPFEEHQVRARDGLPVISYGTSSYGYDVRVDRVFRVFTNVYGAVVDPKAFDPQGMVEIEDDVCLIPPNSFALALSVERFRIPSNVMTICVGKSTYARCGIVVRRQRSTPTRGWPRSCSSNRIRRAACPMRIARESTRINRGSLCRRYEQVASTIRVAEDSMGNRTDEAPGEYRL